MNKLKIVTGLAIACITLVSGCAGGGGGGSSAEEIGPEGSVEMRFWNRSDRTLIAFARWGAGPRVRLGQMSGGRRATYTTAVRGPTLAISWDIISGSPPPATAGAGAAFPQVADGTGDPQCPVNVSAGDRVEWTIGNTGTTCSYIRLDPGLE
ncbi:MAG: hypothetical protein OEO79_10200 [Gemmatimonadota bacterium]|nr:hypothetical protein [Gemmatimonadota bacterium]MDH3424279.1 hypothetical protein [Gemmatimonadota bacterium]